MPRKKPEQPQESAPAEAPVKKPWTLTQADINSITQLESVFGTTRLLPPMEEIPGGWQGYDHDIYTQLVDAIFTGSPRPECAVTINKGFDSSPEAMKQFNLCVMAHIVSFEPKHEHKIAGVAHMIRTVMTITPDKE